MTEPIDTVTTTKLSQNHAVILLASGLSQRLGQPKQLLNKGGEPLVASMLNLALNTKPETVVVVIPDKTLACHSAIATAVLNIAKPRAEVLTVLNPSPTTGMAQSLSLGIDALNAQQNLTIERVLIMGVDQVLLASEHLQQLLKNDKTVVASGYPRLTARFAIDNTKDKIIGLPIVIDYKLLKLWQWSLSGDKGLRHLIRALPAAQLAKVYNAQLSYDIDIPEQLAYAQQQGWLDY